MPPCEISFLPPIQEQCLEIPDSSPSTLEPNKKTIEELIVEDHIGDKFSEEGHILEHLPSSIDTKPSPVDVIESVSSQIDSHRVFEMNLAIAHRQRAWHPWPGVCVHVYHGVKAWLSSCESFLLVLSAAPRANSRVKDLSVEMPDFSLRRKNSSYSFGNSNVNHPIFWILITADPVSNTPNEIVRLIIQQAFQQCPHLPQSEILAQLERTHEEDNLWKVLRLEISFISKKFVIFDFGSAQSTTKSRQVAEDIVSPSSPTSARNIKFLVTFCDGPSRMPESQGPNKRSICVPATPPRVQSVRGKSRPGISVMNNTSFHRSERIQGMCSEGGVRLIYLPPYSPDLNPTEEFFTEFKAFVQRHWQTYEDDR